MSDRLSALADAGVSIWLDDLSRRRLTSGSLAELIATSSVTGVTTNPTIFAGALSGSDDYSEQVRELASAGADAETAIKAIMAADVAEACDLFTHISQATHGVDGRVSIEVNPTKARQTEATFAEAQELWGLVNRPNCFVKIPATVEGLPAITAAIADGISINVTLIFSLERYAAVIDAYLSGLEQAATAGRDLATIHSVASFFVSRVDTEVDERLDLIGTPQALQLKGKAALANARLAYELHASVLAGEGTLGERWAALAEQGANPQRPLWASTGVKNPDYPDTLYVADLVVADTVNTMPEKTMQAFADHGEVSGDRVTGTGDASRAVMASIAEVGIDFVDVVTVLEDEGVAKFVKSGEEMLEIVSAALTNSE